MHSMRGMSEIPSGDEKIDYVENPQSKGLLFNAGPGY